MTSLARTVRFQRLERIDSPEALLQLQLHRLPRWETGASHRWKVWVYQYRGHYLDGFWGLSNFTNKKSPPPCPNHHHFSVPDTGGPRGRLPQLAVAPRGAGLRSPQSTRLPATPSQKEKRVDLGKGEKPPKNNCRFLTQTLHVRMFGPHSPSWVQCWKVLHGVCAQGEPSQLRKGFQHELT